MTFAHAWVLAIAWLPLAWMLYEWRRTSRKLGLTLKALSLVVVLVALADPRLSYPQTKVAVAVLVDTSASVSNGDLDRASQLASAMNGAQGRNWMRIIPFARSTRELAKGENQKPWKLERTAGEAGRATDLEAAIREAVASLPAGLVPRVVLISDGRENKGSIARGAWQAEQLGIPVDTYALSGKLQPALRLESVSLPPVAFTGEQFPIDLTVSAPRAAAAEVELAAEGRSLSKAQVPLAAGVTPIRLRASLNTPGALGLSVTIRTSTVGEVRFDHVIMLRRPKVLFVSKDPPSVDAHLISTLTAAQFEVERDNAFTAASLSSYHLVVLNNWDLESIATPLKNEIERYVRQGGGLLVIGGERNMYKEKKVEDALDRALPAKLLPPRSPEGTAVVLIIDKSSSMEGPKIELARQAAIGVVEHLRPVDLVGVLIFDNSSRWAVPLRKAEDRPFIEGLIAGIVPDGGTQIAPALTEAYQRILTTSATSKHIVLLTDGISEEGDSMGLAQEAANKQVTISTVGLGQDVNRAYLEKIAQFAGGKFYYLNEPAGLEQIVLRDVQEHTGMTTVEKPLTPEVLRQAEILDGVGMETAPALKGYVRFETKPSAETILRLDGKDPLLSRWQFGLGRAIVFTSDAKNRWAADWVAWKGYDKFWSNLSRDLLPHAQPGEATVEFDSANSDLVVNYRLGRGVEEPNKIPNIFVFGADQFEQPVPVKKIADGAYRGRVQIGARQGLFRVRPEAESRAFPEVGLYRPEQELADFGSDEGVLKRVAEFTGGRFQPDPKTIFVANRSMAATLALWPGLLAFAIVLNLFELLLRKWKGVLGKAS